MKKKITFELDEKSYEQLLARFDGDEEALKSFAARVLEKEVSEPARTEAPDKDLEGLDDYLKKGPTGSRPYGIKGQGW